VRIAYFINSVEGGGAQSPLPIIVNALQKGGADVRVVQELLGHASVATTQLYTLVTADAVREAWATAHPRAL